MFLEIENIDFVYRVVGCQASSLLPSEKRENGVMNLGALGRT